MRRVNPVFSSVTGRVKFMERYGLSVHQAATLVLAGVCSAVPSVSRADGSVPSAMASRSPSPYLQGSE